MSRPLRIDYPDAWHHVMNRGRRSEEVFVDPTDYLGFLEVLKEASETWHVRIAAYCLMPNHYHLLLQTPEANLSRFMRHINGVYTQRFNNAHGIDGSLFRGRYKSMLVEGDAYLLEVLRYIHRNPLNAGLVKNLDDYAWSSQRGYQSNGKKWHWLSRDFIFSMLSQNKKASRSQYQAFVSKSEENEINLNANETDMPSFFGSVDFIQGIKTRFFEEKGHKEVPEARLLAPEIETIKDIVSSAYGVSKSELLLSRRGVLNEPRNAAIYLTRQLRRCGLEEIGKAFKLNRYSSVSSAIDRMKKELAKDSEVRTRIEKLRLKITDIGQP